MSTDTKNPGRKKAKKKVKRQDTAALTAGGKLVRANRRQQRRILGTAATPAEKAKLARNFLKKNQARRKARK